MTRPLIQINNEIREMNDFEFQDWQNQLTEKPSLFAPTKEQLLAELTALTAKINALE